MNITVHYVAQLKRAAGVAREMVVVEGNCMLSDLLLRLGRDRGESFCRLLVTEDGRPQPSLLLFHGNEQARDDRPLRDGDEITALTPMSGG